MYAHTYETDLGCCAILALPSAHLAMGTPFDGVLGWVRLLLDPGPESLESDFAEYPIIHSVLVVGGFLCQGLSRANPGRRNLADPLSSLVWVILVTIAHVIREL